MIIYYVSCLDSGMCITEMIFCECDYRCAAMAAFISIIKSPGVCMLKVKVGAVVLAAVFAGSFSQKAEAFNAPTTACTSSNIGQFAYTWIGNSKFEWYCDGSQWIFNLKYQCNQNGLNCIPL